MNEADWKELLHEQKRTNELLEDVAEGVFMLLNVTLTQWGMKAQDPNMEVLSWTRPSKRKEEWDEDKGS